MIEQWIIASVATALYFAMAVGVSKLWSSSADTSEAHDIVFVFWPIILLALMLRRLAMQAQKPWIPGVLLIDVMPSSYALAMRSVRVVDAAIAKMMKVV